ncbi:hypothetical protein BH11PLA2_BH11PLA2_50140 [soil metagenome]
MGRMFRIVTEGPLDAVISGATQPRIVEAAATDPFVGGSSTPYIEVGGPSPVFHAGKPTVKTVDPMTVTPMPVHTPKPVAKTDFLSVALHSFAPKPATAPLSPIASDIVAFHQPDHAVSQEYRHLAADVRKQVGDGSPKAVLFTSAGRDHGTTTVLINLAVTLAKEPGQRVLVLDADFERPTAARKLGLSDLPGLGDVLSQTMPLAWVIQPTAVAKLQVLSAGKLTTENHATLAVDLPRVLAQLRQWFDWILVDGGVWGERPQRDHASPAFDGLYLVTRHHDTDTHASLRPQIARSGGLLKGYITTRG